MTAWNPSDISEMALPPCHCLVQFHVNDKRELSCQLYQRSGDMGLGIPFNIASYALLTHMIAKITDLKPGEFIHTIGNCHIYDNHIDALKLQMTRKPYTFPTISIENREDILEIDDYKFSDFKLINYNSHDKIPMIITV